MKKVYLSLGFCLFIFILHAQVAINENNTNPNASAMLDVSSNDKGLLIPRMTTEERDLIENPAEGLMIYNTSDSCFNYYTGVEWYKDCGQDLSLDKKTLSPITANATGLDDAEDIDFDSQGNILITGRFGGTLEIGDTALTSIGGFDIYLAKYNSNQELIWVAQVGSSGGEFNSHLTLDKDDNIYLIGSFAGSLTLGNTTVTPRLSKDVFLAKYDSDGTIQWLKQTNFNTADTDSEVVADEQGDIYLTGYFQGIATFGATTLMSNDAINAFESFLLKCSSNGNWLWGAQTSNSNGNTRSYDIAIRADTLYWAGEFNDDTTIGSDSYLSSASQGFVAKYDTSGNYVSSIAIGGDEYLEAYAIAVDDSGNYYVGGNLFGDFTFGDTTFTIDEGESFFLTKYNPNNQVEWVNYQNVDEAYVYDIALDRNNDPIAIGDFEGTFTFDELSVSSSTDRQEIFIVKYDKNGNFQWVEKGTSSDETSDRGNGIGINESNIVYALGEYRNTVSFSDVSLTSTGNGDALILRLNSENGAQKLIDNSLANSQDKDTDASNELQSLSLDGSNLSISTGNSVDLSTIQDDLGDHTASENLKTNGFYLSNDGDNEGIFIDSNGLVGIGTNTPTTALEVNGTLTASAFVGDGFGLTNLNVVDYSGDISDLQNDVAFNGGAIDDLDSRITDNQSDIVDIRMDLSDEVADLDVDILELETDISNNQSNISALQNDLQQVVPVGTIQMWSTSSPPTGWLICNGSSFSSSTYPDLANVLGGTTLPNFSGRFPLGVGNSGTSGSTNHNIGSNGGEEKHTLSISEMPNHSHGAGTLSTSEPYLSQEGSGDQDKRDGGGTKLFEYTSITGSTASVGGGQAHSNMPPFYVIHFIIRAE